jgi:outer membrane protein
MSAPSPTRPSTRGAARSLRRSGSASRIALGVTLVLGSACAAHAQSLLELYDAAHGYDATYLSARALAESVPYRIEQSEALMRPSAALAGGAARQQTNPPFGPNYNSNSLSVSVTGRQPLFNRANVETIRQAEKSLDVSSADLDTAEQDLILRLSQAYFDVLGAQDTLDTQRAAKAAISEQLASAKRNFEVGTATITDTREAQARYDLATSQEIAAENDLVTKRIALDQLVGRQNIMPKQIAVPVALPPLVPDTAEGWVDQAEAQHPVIRRALIALEVAKLETAKARAAALPTVDAIGSVSGARGAIGGSFGGTVGNNTSTSLGLQLNMPLYSGGSIQNRIKETLVLEDRSQNDLDTARRSVSQATRQAFYNLLSGAAQVRALEAAESSSQLALEATQLGYRVGVRVNLDVLNAQSQLFQTRRDLARARYDLLLGTLRLRQAAGVVTAQDVTAVDRQLAP